MSGVDKLKIKSKSQSNPRKYPDEEKTKWVKFIDAKRTSDPDLSVKRAVELAAKHFSNPNISSSIYWWWKRKMEGTPYKRTAQTFQQKLAKDAETVRNAVERHAQDLSIGPIMPTREGGVKVTVREYTFEGSHQEVLNAVNYLKK